MNMGARGQKPLDRSLSNSWILEQKNEILSLWKPYLVSKTKNKTEQNPRAVAWPCSHILGWLHFILSIVMCSKGFLIKCSQAGRAATDMPTTPPLDLKVLEGWEYSRKQLVWNGVSIIWEFLWVSSYSGCRVLNKTSWSVILTLHTGLQEDLLFVCVCDCYVVKKE